MQPEPYNDTYLSGGLVGAIVCGWLPIDHLEKIGAVIVSPIVALLGAVMGFYFGEQSRNRSS
jgi:hypothetical protein